MRLTKYIIAARRKGFISLLLSIVAVLASCGTKDDCYFVKYTENEITLNNRTGSISFPIVGTINTDGNTVEGVLLPGSILTMVNSDEDKLQTVVFEYSAQDSSIKISTTSVYKRDCVIEYDGIIGECSGDIGLERDRNVFVCGNPVLVGYTDKTKKHFAICPEYGELTPYYSKLEEKYYKTKTIKAGDTLSTSLVIFNSDELPIRMLCQPNGERATFTIAAHADRARSLVVRAILWGTSDTASSDYGKKGMLSNGLIGTLSVFAKHTEQYRAAEALDVPFFKKEIDKAYLHGMEICPHTISFWGDDRSNFEQYLPVFEENYHSRNWIDHFLRKEKVSSGLHSAGGIVKNDFYVMDLMSRYGYQYCWSYIDTPKKDEEPADQLWSGHYMFPRHLVYQNEYLSFPDGTGIYQYKNAWEQLEKVIVNKEGDPVKLMQTIIDNCGVWTDHSYLIGEFDKLYEKDNNKSEYRILPKFESFLEFLAEKKTSGELWNPTMSEFCDYMVKLENVNVSRLSRGKYQIINNNSEPVSCSFLYKGDGNLVLNGVPMNMRNSENGNVFYGMVEVGGGNILIVNKL